MFWIVRKELVLEYHNYLLELFMYLPKIKRENLIVWYDIGK